MGLLNLNELTGLWLSLIFGDSTAKPFVNVQTQARTDRQTDRQTDRRTGGQTYRQTDRQAGRQAGRQAIQQENKKVGSVKPHIYKEKNV